MKLIISFIILIIGLPLISFSESDDARITKLEEEIKKLQESNSEILKKLSEGTFVKRRILPIPSLPQEPAKEVELTERVIEFGGHTYKFVPTKMSWKNAKKAAESMGGYLVCITSQAEQEAIEGLIAINRQVLPTWIGLTDEEKEGEFKWVNGEKTNYTNWGSGNPNNDDDRGAKQNYVWLGFCGSSKWDDNWEYALNYSVVEFDKPLPLPKQSTEKVKEVEPSELLEEFAGHTYQFIPEKKTWNSARKIAQQKTGYLVSITSEDENKFITSLIQKACAKRNEKNPHVWIGLSNDNDENKWTWESGEKYEFNSWCNGEPNNWGGFETAVQFNKNANIDPEGIGRWNDMPSDSKTYFVIEIEKSKSSK